MAASPRSANAARRANASSATFPITARPSNSAIDFQLPREQLSLRIARKGRSFLAKVIWWRDNFVGVAFRAESPAEPVSDLGERLRRSEIKKRQLQRQIDELLGER